MLQIIQVVIAFVVLSILYTRMISRETPEPISKVQSIVQVVLGLLSFPVSFGITLGFALALTSVGITVNALPIAILRPFVAAFVAAGFTEELAKLLLLLVATAIFKPKNVYEYMIAGAGIGFGFTLLEEFFYGGTLVSLTRIPTIGAHMVFDIIMGYYLGLARHNKVTGNGSVGTNYVLALVVPVLLHTLLDAFTAFNPALQIAEEDVDAMAIVGLVLALGMLVAATVGQVIVLLRMKKNAQEYCGMETR